MNPTTDGPMDTDKADPIYKAESQQIVGCAMDVRNVEIQEHNV
jgi:hypothetical protein